MPKAKSPGRKARAAQASWFLYLLECHDGSIYTGIALNVEKRFALHRSGKGARYTRAHPPKKILASLRFLSRSEASRAEYTAKQWSAARKREFCAQLAEGGKKREWKKIFKMPKEISCN